MLRDGNWDLWVYDLERGVATRITFGPGYDADPVWSPDGRWLAFASDRDGDFTVYRKRADGSGQAERLLDPEMMPSPFPTSWSPDGKWLAVSPTGAGGNDLWVVPVDGKGDAEAWMATPYAEVFPAFSPEGRWIAYQSDESGRHGGLRRVVPGRRRQVADLGRRRHARRCGRATAVASTTEPTRA